MDLHLSACWSANLTLRVRKGLPVNRPESETAQPVSWGAKGCCRQQSLIRSKTEPDFS
jgi:hypothetical protein